MFKCDLEIVIKMDLKQISYAYIFYTVGSQKTFS